MFSFTVTKTHTCLHGWSILFMKPKSAQSNSGLYRGAAHAVSYKENKEEYTRKVKEFTDRYIH